VNGLNKAWNQFQKYISPAMLATILAAIVVGILLFIPPINGYADNGDFYRAMLSNGIYRLPQNANQYVGYVVSKFGLFKYFNENNVAVFSSQAVFVKLAVILNRIFYSHQYFDIRFLGAVYYVTYLPAVYLLTKALVEPARRVRSYALAILVVLIFGDSSFTLYFNSFFAEPGMLIAFMYASAAIILLARGRYQHPWKLILLYFISVVFLITNKQQNAPLVLSFGLISAGMFFLPKFKKPKKLALVGGIGAIFCAGIMTYSLANQELNDANKYQSFTHGVLMENGDPSKRITKGEINEQFALMREQDYYAKTFDTVDPSSAYVKKHLTDQYSLAWIVRYYAQNPKQFVNLLDVATKDVMITQVKAVGDYTKDAGKKPGEQTRYFTLYSQVVSTFFPKKYAFICLLAVTLVLMYGVSGYVDLKAGRTFGVMRFFLILGLMTICVFVPIVSIIAVGDADLAKQLLMVPLSFDLVFLVFIADMLNNTLWMTETREAADE
jgi:hypothetical protein